MEMKKVMYLIECPKCHGQMKTQTSKLGQTRIIQKNYMVKEAGWTHQKTRTVRETIKVHKICVYCGHRFCIHHNINRSQIIKRITKRPSIFTTADKL